VLESCVLLENLATQRRISADCGPARLASTKHNFTGKRVFNYRRVAIRLQMLVGRGLADPDGPLPPYLHQKTLNLADLQTPFAPIGRLTATTAIKLATLA
jgi:hypothetical protein